MKCIYILGLIFISLNLMSQRGKDGIPTISAANTIVNAYTPLTGNAAAGSTTLNVGSSASFAVGDLVFIIQMQGANVYSYDGGFTGPWYDSNTAFPGDTAFGRITNYNNAGMNEFAQVNSIPNGSSIVIDCGLKNNYDVTKNYTTQSNKNIVLLGNVQVIRVPRYSYLTLSGAASITCPQWNGSTGGITVVEVQNDATLNTTGAFNVSGKGFRGGAVFNYTPTTVISSDKFGSNLSGEGGRKGESIAGDSGMYRNYASVFTRGAIANGGGGGNSHNAGGGGGSNGHNGLNYNGRGNPVSGYNAIWDRETSGFSSNVSSGGGRGGYSFSNSNQNVNSVSPGTYSTSSNAWNGDKRRAVGGYGGRPLNYVNGVLFIGGGGGSGHENDGQGTSGANGGGMVYLVCYGNLSGSGTILADGGNASNTNSGCTSNDGAGGGGGGGTIVLNVNGSINLTAGTALSAVGGNGGNVVFNCVSPGIAPNYDGYGPGAGGGGGHIISTGTLPSNTIAGGANGIMTGSQNNNANSIKNAFPPNGATRGGSGGLGSVTAYTLTPSASQTICTNQTFTVTATSTEPGTTIYWYNTSVGNSAIATGTTYAAPAYPTAGTYTLYAGACTGTYRQPILITVSAGLNMTANSPTICPGQTATLTAGGATTYTWSSGPPNTNTLSVTPAITTTYVVNGTSGTCVGSYTTTVIVSAVPSLTVNNASICSGNTATLTASGASNYTWAPDGQLTTSITDSPGTTKNYTITGSNGACTNSTTATVSVTATPTLVVNSVTICAGQTATLSASGAPSFTWNPGGVIASTYTTSPASSTTVSVIGANGTCTSSETVSVTIGTGISISVNNPTICAGQTATLIAGGASTYTWSSGPPNTNTLIVSPGSTTTYTISGTNGVCSGSNTAVVTVISAPSLTVTNASICSGNTATLTASGAASYTWAPDGQTTASITDNPNSTKIYTVTGSNGVCSGTAVTSISVTPTPTLAGVVNLTICPTQTVLLNAGGALTYTWNPGNVSGSSYSIAPTSNTVISVIGANGTCTSQATSSVTISTGISIAVNNPTICAGQTATLIAGGASTYTWSSPAATGSTININPGTTTVYTVSGTTGACSGTTTATVVVNPVPTLTVNSAAICSGQTATLTASGANTYTWSNSVNGSSQIVNPSSITVYTVSGTDINGCVNTSLTTSTVNVTATPTISANSTSICIGQTATLTATGATSYTWSTNEISATINPSPVLTTSYSVLGSNGGCASGYTTSVIVTPSPTLSINASNTSGCAPLCINFTDQTSSSCSTISYNFGDGSTGSSNNPNHCYNSNGNYTVTATCTSTLGCASTYTLPTAIQVILTPSANFNIEEGTVITVGSTVHLTNTSANATSSIWDLCNGNTSILTDVTTSYPDTGNCCITLLTANGTCTNSVTKCVSIVNEAVVVIPNVFTPNGDNKNEVFKIKSIGLKNLNCVIFDRWGLKMYEWDGINGYWDGSTKSGTAPDGTYFYIINYTDQKDKSTTEKGFLNLFKD